MCSFFLWSLVNVLSLLCLSSPMSFSLSKPAPKSPLPWGFPCLHKFSLLEFHRSLSHLHCTVIICSKLCTSDKWFSLLCLSFLITVSWGCWKFNEKKRGFGKEPASRCYSHHCLARNFPIGIPPIKLRAPWIAGNHLYVPGTMLSVWHFQEPNLGYL